MKHHALLSLTLLFGALPAQEARSVSDDASRAWQAFVQANGDGWTAHWSKATSTPYSIYGPGLRVQASRVESFANARRLANDLLERHAALLGRGASAFVEDDVAKVNMTYIHRYRQTFAGLDVIGGRADVRLNEIGVVAMFGAKAAPIPAGFDTTPRVAADNAVVAAHRHLGTTPQISPLGALQQRAPRLVVWAQVEGTQPTPVRLAWEVKIDQRQPDVVAGEVYVDARTGNVLEFVNGVYECGLGHRHVRGEDCGHDDADEGAPAPLPIDITGNVRSWLNNTLSPIQPLTNENLANIRVQVQGGNTGFTDANGNFTIAHAGSTPVNVTVTMTGRYIADVNPLAGTRVSLTQLVTPGVPANLQLLTSAAAENDWSQPTVAHWVDRTYRFMDAQIVGGASSKARIAAVTATVNRASTCNAFYTGNTINFYAQGGGCNMTAYSTVVSHEWGHGVDDAFGGISQTDGLSEGWGDIFSILLTGQPVVGQDFTTSGGIVRTALNTLTYPAGGGVHQQGQTWMGFAWDVRTNLIASLGQAPGVARTNLIVIGSLAADATNQPDAVREVFILDDDDGNLANGTPNYGALAAAAMRRRLPFPEIQVGSVTHTPLGSTDRQLTPRIVSANVSVVSGSFTRVELVYDAGAGTQRRTMVPSGTGNERRALLPGVLSPQTVSYHIEADHSSNVTFRVPASGEISYSVGQEQVFYSESFDTGAAGWTHGLVLRQDDWQLGTPQGLGGTSNGVTWQDPSSAVSGANAYGNDLGIGNFNGAYQPNVHNWLRSPILNLTGLTGVTLRFQRWLTVEESQFDQASILVNNQQVWVNPFSGHTVDTAWSRQEIPIPPANNNPAVQLEWRLVTDAGLNLGGWAIDDVELFSFTALPAPAFQYRANPEQVGIGGSTQLALQGAASAPVAMLFSASNGPITLPGVGQLEVGNDFVSIITGTNGSGAASFNVQVPNVTAFVGRLLFSQGVIWNGSALVPSNPMIHLFQ